MKTVRPAWMYLSSVVLTVSLFGCNKSASGTGSKHSKLFTSADPAIKAAWETAMAAVGTNGYVTASQSFKELLASTLTPDQVKAVTETATALSDQMYAAANSGDANAIAALKELGKTKGR